MAAEEAEEASRAAGGGGGLRARERERSEAERYMARHRILAIIEALVGGLAVDRPEHARAYLKQALERIRGGDLQGVPLSWESLIPVERRPPKPILPYWLLKHDDDPANLPTQEMYETALAFRNKHLLSMVIAGWIKYAQACRSERKRQEQLMRQAAAHAAAQRGRRTLRAWQARARLQVLARQRAIEAISGRARLRTLRPAWGAWRRFIASAHEAARWFQQQQEALEAERRASQASLTAEMDESADGFSSLPMDIRLDIFGRLGLVDLLRCMLVCRAWLDVARNSLLWARVDLSLPNASVTDYVVQQIASRYRTDVIQISLARSQLVTDTSLTHLKDCRNLQDVRLAGCPLIRDKGVRTLLGGCKSLMHLDLSNCSLTDATLRALGLQGENLETLLLQNCTRLTDTGVEQLGKGSGCRRLHTLNINGCVGLSSDGIERLLETAGAYLQNLSMDGCKLQDSTLEVASHQSPNLRSVSISNCKKLGNRALRHLARCSFLVNLRACGNGRFSGPGVQSLVQGARGLRSIALERSSRLDDRAMAALARLPVVSIDLASCPGITDTSIRTVSECNVLRVHLTTLDMSGCSLTDHGVSLFKSFKRLQSLALRNCTKLTNTSLAVVLQIPTLLDVDLSGCLLLTDEPLIALGRQPETSELTSVNMSGCVNLTELGVEGLTAGCPKLLKLDLSNCNHLNDDAVRHIAFHCRRLQTLGLQGCWKLTDAAVNFLANGCLQLCSVNLFDIRSLTNSAVATLTEKCKNLRFISISSRASVSMDAVQTARRSRRQTMFHFDIESAEASGLEGIAE